MRGNLAILAGCAALVLGLTVQANEKPTAEYQKSMKDLGAANQTLRVDISAYVPDFELIASHAGKMKTAFAPIVEYWTAKKTEDAIKLAQNGAKGAADLEAAAKASNLEKAIEAQTALNAACMGCHSAHRERLPDGTFEIK